MTEHRAARSRRLVRPRLNLRLAMVVILVLGIGMGWFITKARRQAETAELIRRSGGHVEYDWEVGRNARDPGPKWITDLVGPDYNHEITSIRLAPNTDHVDDFWVHRLGELRGLEYLDLIDCPSLTDAGLSQLSALHHLERLSLSGTGVTARSFAFVRGLPELRMFNAMGVAISDDDLANFSGLPLLRSLVFQGDRISDAGLAHLRPLQEIESIQIPSKGTMRITAAGLSHLSRMKKLRQLNLFATEVESLEPLRNLPSLEVLYFLDARLDDDDLSPVTTLTRLRFLALSGKSQRFGDDGLAHLSQVTTFEHLYLTDTKVGDAGLRHLSGLPKLRELTLDGTRVTDEGIAHLAAFPSLRALSLNRTEITDNGLSRLATMSGLIKISLKETGVTEAGIAALKVKIPTCQIER